MPTVPKTGDGAAVGRAGDLVRDYTVRSVQRACSILNLLQHSVDGVSLVDVGAATELPKSSAFRYLWTLEQHRYVERDADTGTYRLGLGFIGMQPRHLELLRQRARPVLAKLRDDLGETVNLGVLESDFVVYLDIVESRRNVRLAAAPGDRDALHSTALGKAVAAHLPEAQVRESLQRLEMSARTVNTITSIDDYLVELARVRRTGYAIDDRENEPDGRCVAVIIPDTPLPAAISLSAPSARLPLQHVQQVALALTTAAALIAGAEVAPTEVATGRAQPGS